MASLPHRSRLRAASLVLGCTITAALFSGGCTGVSSSATSATPPGPPSLRIKRVVSSGGGTASCLAPGRDPRQTLVVSLETLSDGTLKNWTLQPPHGCDGTPQCGYVVLRIDGCDPGSVDPDGKSCHVDPARHLELIAVGSTISVPMASLEPPTGTFRLQVQLWSSDGTRATDANGNAFTDSRVVDVEARCAAAADAGADAGGPLDASAPDASTPDGAADASARDGAVSLDAALPGDARVSDAALRDAAPPGDAASSPDAGPRDAAVRDAARRD